MYFDSNANHPMLKCAEMGYLEGIKYNNISSTKDPKAMKYKDDLTSAILAEHGNNYDVIYTSGGSESNSTIIYQLLHEYILTGKKPRVVCSTIEHASISYHLQQLEEQNIISVDWIKPDAHGIIHADSIQTKNISMIFLQSVNSETGAIQNIKSIYELAQRENILFAVDNVQGFMKRVYPTNVGDYISISFHKVGGPIGFGALLIKKDLHFYPMIGGKQNKSMRGGTYNIGAMVASLCAIKRFDYKKASENGKYFWKQIKKKILVKEYNDLINGKVLPAGPYIIRFGEQTSLPHTAFFSMARGHEIKCGTMIKNKLAKQGIIIATGSACNNESATIIGSMNSSDIHDAVKKGFLRISFSEKNNKSEINKLIESLFLVYN